MRRGSSSLVGASRRLSSEAAFLRRRSANHAPLTPLTFLARAADVYPDRVAIVYDDWAASPAAERTPATERTWAETSERVGRLASGLRHRFGVERGDTVAVLSPNTPAFLEAHFGVMAAGAVINPINTRLDAPALAYILRHSAAKVLLADSAHATTVEEALSELELAERPRLVSLVDTVAGPHAGGGGGGWGEECEYEELLAGGSPEEPWRYGRDLLLISFLDLSLDLSWNRPVGTRLTSGRRRRSTTRAAPPAGRRGCCSPTAARR